MHMAVPAGNGLGIRHGIISPVELVVSYFFPGGQMPEVHNKGSQYNFGFPPGGRSFLSLWAYSPVRIRR
jgi:hypothetical protein